MNTTRMIKGHELFESLSFEEVEKISNFSGPKEYQAGDTVFRRGQRGTHFFVVLDGQVELEIPSTDSESKMVADRLEGGEILGLSPLLGVPEYTTTAHCREASTVLAVEVEPFRRIIEDNSSVGMKIMQAAARTYFTRYINTLGRIHNILNELAVH